MRTQLPALLFSLLFLVGCKSASKVEQPSTRPLVSDDVIRQKIIGTWQSDAHSFPGRTVTLAFGADGSFNGSTLYGSERAWRADKGWVVVTPVRGALPTDSDESIAIWSLDDHELTCRPGFSTAGDPWRFTR